MGAHRFHRGAVFAGAIAAAALFGGCALFRPHIDDLAFVSLKPVPSPARREDRVMLSLHFSTSRDLLELDDYGAYLHASFCPFTQQPDLFVRGIRYRGQTLESYKSRGQHKLTQSSSASFEYEAVLYYDNQWQFDPKQHTTEPLALPAEPQDVCFKAEGLSYWGSGGFDSNVAIIPKDALARALVELRSTP